MRPVQEDHPGSAPAEEVELVARRRAGDEEVGQEAWLGVLNGLDRFEGRSSLKTWILRILVNTALTRGGREARIVPFSSLAPADQEEPAVEPERFRPPGEAYAGHWNAYPGDWAWLLPESAPTAAMSWRRASPRRSTTGPRSSSRRCARARRCWASWRRGSRRSSAGPRRITLNGRDRQSGLGSGWA